MSWPSVVSSLPRSPPILLPPSPFLLPVSPWSSAWPLSSGPCGPRSSISPFRRVGFSKHWPYDKNTTETPLPRSPLAPSVRCDKKRNEIPSVNVNVTLAYNSLRGGVAEGRGGLSPDCGDDGSGVYAVVLLFFVFLAWLFFTAFSLSALIRSRRTEAGSSFGSCGTSRPEKAFFRIDWRRVLAIIS